MNFTMSFSELMPLAPVMIVALTAIVVMILTAIKRNHNLIATATVVGLNLSVIYILMEMFGGHFVPANVMGMFMVDPFTMLYQLLILIAALACSTLSHAYIETYKSNREELYILLLTSVVGAMLMVSSSHYASFFISLELMSIPVYGLLAYTHPLKDLNAREIALLLICAFGLLWLGLYPQSFLDVSNSSMAWLANSYIPVQEVVEVADQVTTQLENVEIQ